MGWTLREIVIIAPIQTIIDHLATIDTGKVVIVMKLAFFNHRTNVLDGT